jgi:hypothetical protein
LLAESLGCGARSWLDDGSAADAHVNTIDGGRDLDATRLRADSQSVDARDVGSPFDHVVVDARPVPDEGADTPPPCGPANCTSCCEPDGTCATTGSGETCGSGGTACVLCPATYHCDKNPYCVKDAPACGPGNCDGCCSNLGLGPNNYCLSGFSGGLCGRQGEVCATCDSAAGLQCVPDPSGVGGSCRASSPACDATTCNGCCYGEVCATGMQDIACGTRGVACADCTSSGQACVGQVCGD